MNIPKSIDLAAIKARVGHTHSPPLPSESVQAVADIINNHKTGNFLLRELTPEKGS